MTFIELTTSHGNKVMVNVESIVFVSEADDKNVNAYLVLDFHKDGELLTVQDSYKSVQAKIELALES